jgi:signal transduction histidine kinase/DNA-binding response OmpR family regulator
MANPEKIMIVDDNPEMCEVVAECLKPLRHTVICATTGPQALDLIERKRFGVVVLDLLLPGSDGMEILRHIREQRPETEIIVLTAYASLETAIEALRLGAYDYVTKPFHPDTIRSTVRRAAEKHLLETRLTAICDLSREIVLSLDVHQVAQAVLDIVERVLEFEICSLYLVDEEQECLHRLAACGPGKEAAATLPLSEEDQLIVAAACSREPVCVPNVVGGPGCTGISGTSRSELAVPLKTNVRVIGVLNVESTRVNAFSQDDMRLVSTLAAQASVAIENARLYEQAQQEIAERKRAEAEVKRRNRELAALNKTGQAITSTLDLDEVLKLAMAEARAMLDAEGASVLLYDTTEDELVFAASAGLGSDVLVGTRMPATAGIAGWAMQKAQPVLVRDAQNDKRFYGRVDDLTGVTTHSLVAVPLTCKGQAIGVIEAINRTGRAFDEHDLELLGTLAGSAAIAIANARLYEAEREQRRLLEQSQAELVQSEKLAATGRLAASLAHEINNPLQAIHNSLQLMVTFSLEPDEQREYLQMANEEVRRLISMVTRTLDFARRPQRDLKPTDPNEVIEKVLALTKKYLQHRRVVLRRELCPDLPPVMAAPDELGQVFLNLVLNAVDAMPEGGELQVSSRLAEDGCLAMSFSDTGHGIHVEHVDHIFEPFFSTKDEGTGLGLSVSYNVIKRHKGEITLKSKAGEGATFTVWLPVLSEQEMLSE